MRRAAALGLLVVGAGLVGVLLLRPPPPPPLPPGPRVELQLVARGLEQPVHLAHAGDGTGRLFVVEQAGRIRILTAEGRLAPAPFLDIGRQVRAGGECGLLAVAFHPAYARSRRLFVNYTTRRAGRLQTIVAEYRAAPDDPGRALPDERVLLAIDQPYGNHNGGQLAFGPDGMLYVGMGDGGSAGDPHGHGQDRATLLGALLRIDVDRLSEELPYGIPPDNPLAGGGGRPELFAWGLRNPWRFSFDRARPERLFVADVGQNHWEEVHLVRGGDNCGWNRMEGNHCYPPGEECDRSGLTLPIAEYHHREGLSITGGFVYRGARYPELQGIYLFCDYFAGPIWGLREAGEGRWQRVVLGDHRFLASSFGEDEQGELYLLDHGEGRVLRLVPGA